MQDFTYGVPTQFVFGEDAELRVGYTLKAAGYKNILLHYGKGSVIRSGLLDRVKASLDAAGISYVELGGVRPNPEITLIREGIALMREHKLDMILAVGGGSVIDSSKGIAAGTYYEGDVWDLYSHEGRGFVPMPHGCVPIASVLTIPAAGSEASAFTVVSNDELGLKSSLGAQELRPQFAFMNPRLTFTLPAYQTACGATDMFAHCLERFFSESPWTPVTDNMLIGLMRTIVEVAPRVLANPESYDDRANIMWTGMLAHCGISGCGRVEDWSTHALEHELSALNPEIAHGAGLSVMFPAWMRFVYTERPERFALYGERVFDLTRTGDDTVDALAAIQATRDFFTRLGMPANLGELGITESDIPRMIPTLKINKGEHFGSFKVLSLDDCVEIYKLAL